MCTYVVLRINVLYCMCRHVYLLCVCVYICMFMCMFFRHFYLNVVVNIENYQNSLFSTHGCDALSLQVNLLRPITYSGAGYIHIERIILLPCHACWS